MNPSNRLKIAFVDDDPMTRDLIGMMLESSGFEPELFANGASALKGLRQRKFDLLITDIQMPDLSGMQLVETLRSEKIELPVIIMTAYGNIDLAVRSLRLKVCDFLCKPVTPEGLTDSIRRVLSLPESVETPPKVQKPPKTAQDRTANQYFADWSPL